MTTLMLHLLTTILSAGPYAANSGGVSLALLIAAVALLVTAGRAIRRLIDVLNHLLQAAAAVGGLLVLIIGAGALLVMAFLLRI